MLMVALIRSRAPPAACSLRLLGTLLYGIEAARYTDPGEIATQTGTRFVDSDLLLLAYFDLLSSTVSSTPRAVRRSAFVIILTWRGRFLHDSLGHSQNFDCVDYNMLYSCNDSTIDISIDRLYSKCTAGSCTSISRTKTDIGRIYYQLCVRLAVVYLNWHGL